MVIEISEQQFQDYLYCPIYYALRYNSKLKVEKPPTISKLLSRIAQGFCQKLKDGEVDNLYNLKRKWSMYCKKYPEIINDANNRYGMDMVYKMFLWAEEQELRIAAVGTPYEIKIKADYDIIKYHGQLGIIGVIKNNTPENIVFNFNRQVPDQANIDLNLKTSLDHIGFNTLYEGGLSGTRIHHVKSSVDFFTTRDVNQELQRTASIIKNAVKSIQKNIWYPHESVMCPHCITRDFCLLYGRNNSF